MKKIILALLLLSGLYFESHAQREVPPRRSHQTAYQPLVLLSTETPSVNAYNNLWSYGDTKSQKGNL